MSHIVISQTWLHDGGEHLAASVELVESFDRFLRSQPGFASRRLVCTVRFGVAGRGIESDRSSKPRDTGFSPLTSEVLAYRL